MTDREEAINLLDNLIGMVDDNHNSNYDETLKMAIKALQQESILDKLRAELHETAEMHRDGVYYLRDEWIDEYFDKYKAESEE